MERHPASPFALQHFTEEEPREEDGSFNAPIGTGVPWPELGREGASAPLAPFGPRRRLSGGPGSSGCCPLGAAGTAEHRSTNHGPLLATDSEPKRVEWLLLQHHTPSTLGFSAILLTQGTGVRGRERGIAPAGEPHLPPAAGMCLGAPEPSDTPITGLPEPSPPVNPFSFEKQTSSIFKMPHFSPRSSQDKVPPRPHATQSCQEKTAVGVSRRGSKQ